ncbi:DUF4089 domain-containing protein [Agarilytica rhodophyticola]|uniref:DUF4089 domain-containing protein n=1 Tax=Agarilytica rhodophyticola TaxID=1737490 RepID=UPI000B341215|nr:DUF4089 domain-containing protein [Agarilytica rhodophyticola]
MTKKHFDSASYLAFMAPCIGIEIKEEWKDEIIGHLDNAAKMANIVENADIDKDSLDLANTYSPD